MNRTITVTFAVDPSEYHRAGDSREGAVRVAKAILRGEADWPDDCTAVIRCEGQTAYLKVGP